MGCGFVPLRSWTWSQLAVALAGSGGLRRLGYCVARIGDAMELPRQLGMLKMVQHYVGRSESSGRVPAPATARSGGFCGLAPSFQRSRCPNSALAQHQASAARLLHTARNQPDQRSLALRWGPHVRVNGPGLSQLLHGRRLRSRRLNLNLRVLGVEDCVPSVSVLGSTAATANLPSSISSSERPLVCSARSAVVFSPVEQLGRFARHTNAPP